MENEIQQHQTSVQMLQAPGQEVDAVTDVNLQVGVSCPEKCALEGGRIRICDEKGAVVKEEYLASFDGEANETDAFSVRMPVEPGSHTWTALFVPPESEEVPHAPSSADFHFTVKPHRVFVSVWDVPSPVVKGQRFTVHIAAKCSAGCLFAGLPLAIQDGHGKVVATGKLGEEVLPETSGSYWVEQELVAPPEEGLCEWTVNAVTSSLELPHEVAPKPLTFYAASPAEHTATVLVVNKDSQAPVKDASIFVNRHRVTTDEHGMAKVEVTKGTHELYVAVKHYDAYQATVEVTGDIEVKAELAYNPDPYNM